jgi:hypothetical protein
MAIKWPPTDEINGCNDDLIMTITKVIAGNKILSKSSNFVDIA